MPASPLPLVVASRNQAKVAEIERLIGDLTIVRPPGADSALGQESEAASSLAANAEAKALLVSREEAGRLVVATDGGLLVPALGEYWNPLQTRRFAGENATDRKRASHLLALMRPYSGQDRRIGWREAMAVAYDGKIIATWTAESPPGLLANDLLEESGVLASGFWIPSLWLCPEFDGRRLIDLTIGERARHDDHWARLGIALRRLVSSNAAAGAEIG